MLEVVGPWFWARKFYDKHMGYWFIIYPCVLHFGPIIGYFWEGDHAVENGVWNYFAKSAVMCATISP